MKKIIVLNFLIAVAFYSNGYSQSNDSTKLVNPSAPPDSALKIIPAPLDNNGTTANNKMYHVKIPLVSAIIAVGGATDLIAINRIKGKANISDAEIDALNPLLLNVFDRWGLHQNTSDRDLFKKVSDYSQVPFDLLPLFLMTNKKVQKEWLPILLMFVEGHTITFSFYNYSPLGPTFQNRYRPMTYYSEYTLQERENGNNRNSFYSGHVASCSYSSFFMAKVYCDYHPNIKGGKKILVYSAAAIPPLLMSWFRVKALDHFTSDCLVGLTLGAVMGVVIPDLHKFHCKNIGFGVATFPNATGLSFHWNMTTDKKVANLQTLALRKE